MYTYTTPSLICQGGLMETRKIKTYSAYLQNMTNV